MNSRGAGGKITPLAGEVLLVPPALLTLPPASDQTLL